MQKNPEEIGKRMVALELWNEILPFNWAIKPKGTVIPYFCTTMLGDGKFVKVRFFLLEGWQTLHDFVRTRVDRNFGFYSTPMELPHFELVVRPNGEVALFRHDPGYVPRPLTEAEREFVGRLLWEAYGVMMRIESEAKLPLKYSDEKAMFSRVETAPGVWEDAPLEIPEPRPHVEKITFEKKDISQAKDIPFDAKEAIELDFRLLPNLTTRETRARFAYVLCAIDSATGERFIWDRISVGPECGLKEMWEKIPPRILKQLLARGRIPGEIKVTSGRVFRILRPLCQELPFKLSLHDALPRLEEAFRMS